MDSCEGAQEPAADLLRQPAFQEFVLLFRQFIAAAGNGHGAAGIARVLQQRTEMAVIVEDAGGHVIATGDGESLVAADGSWRSRPLPDHASHAVAIFDLDRWVAVACPRGEVLGAISLLECDKPATGIDLFGLEQAATVLGWELLHNRSVAEAELALWDDFTTELFEDSNVGRVRLHALRLGYDLNRTHRAVLAVPSGPMPSSPQESARQATERLGATCLVTTRSNGVVLVVPDDLKWTELARVLEIEWGCKVRIGIGGRYRLEDLSRSLDDAEFALGLTSFGADRTVALFDELGVWRLLARPDAGGLQELVDRWIGVLIDYDREHRSELVKTLFAYLNEFGALEAAAAKLFVHRNTLKYRLARVAELTGWDVNDPEQRFHLDLACRAWLVRKALERPSPTTWRDAAVSATPPNPSIRPAEVRPGSLAAGNAR